MNFKSYEFIVIAGMAKTGTTLPLTLLDGHPELTVFPEELRFFHKSIHSKKASNAAKVLLADVKKLNIKNEFYSADNYMRHGGTGFGKRDYSDFDFQNFKSYIQNNFNNSDNEYNRFLTIIEAFIVSNRVKRLKNDNVKFVSKAPHNEKYIGEWNEMLNDKVKYILCTRVPTEHFVSLGNVNEMRETPRNFDVYHYVNSVKSHRKYWAEFPKESTYVLDYDLLLRHPEKIMREIAEFLNIKFNKSMLSPTKYGVEWSGNSSRGIIENKIFVNKHKAKEVLDEYEIKTIEYSLHDMYEENNWGRTLNKLGLVDIFKMNAILSYYSLTEQIINKTRKILSRVIPKPVKAYFKA